MIIKKVINKNINIYTYIKTAIKNGKQEMMKNNLEIKTCGLTVALS